MLVALPVPSRRLPVASLLLLLLALLGLAACNGGNGGSGAGSGAANIGADGGSVVTGGIQVVVPAGALTDEVTIRVAEESTNAPPLPVWARAADAILALTPHGSVFAEPVTVRMQAPAVTLAADERLVIAKAQPGGDWVALMDTELQDGELAVQVSSFSYFVPVVVKFTPPVNITDYAVPFSTGPVGFLCNGAVCPGTVPVGTEMVVTASSAGNGGSLPTGCIDARVVLRQTGSDPVDLASVLATPAVVASGRVSFAILSGVYETSSIRVESLLRCVDGGTNAVSFARLGTGTLQIDSFSTFKRVPVVREFPQQVVLAPGEQLAFRAVLSGGSSYRLGSAFAQPAGADEVPVFLERMEPGDTVWRTVVTNQQRDADARPTGAQAWAYWGFQYDLGPVGAGDNGASFRLRSCLRVSGNAAFNCAVGPEFMLTVVQQTTLPVFTSQPLSQHVLPGETASFDALVAGTPPPALQWQTRAPGASGWSDIAGATGTTLTTTAATLADNGRVYRVVATNAAGAVPSAEATLSVDTAIVAPAITSHPAPLTVIEGSEAVFAVAAQGTAALSYQWLRDGVDITGANSPQLKLAAVTAADAADYSVRVSNQAGIVQSSAARLTVTAVPTGTPVAPSIVTAPVALAVTAGNTATFGVGVSGSGPFGFQWLRDGVAISGATAATFTLPAVTAADAANYSVTVSNSAGSVTSSPATLAVAPAGGSTPVAEPPVIAAQPATTVVAPGMPALLAVSATGSGPLSFMWLRDGQMVPGQNSAVLVVPAATALDAGSYTVQISNSAGSVTSAAAQLVLLGAPSISAHPTADPTVYEGLNLVMGVMATGDALRYQWTRNGLAISGATDANYSTPLLTLADSGAVFQVMVYNGAGLVISNPVVLTVVAAPPPTNVVWAMDLSAPLPPEVNPGSALVEDSQGFGTLGPAGHTPFGPWLLRSATGNVVTITVDNLPAHQWLSLDFLFAAIDSLDGTGAVAPEGDFFRVTVDGVDVFRESFANALTTQVQSYVAPPGVELARRVDLGFSQSSLHLDSAYWMGGEPAFQQIAHSASSVTISMQIEGVGNQDLNDESWGLAQLQIIAGP